MKIKQTIAVLAGLLVAVNVFAQGQVTFNNSGSSRVVDGTTGANAAPNTLIAGLYYSTDLGAVPDASIGAAPDGFLLAGTTPVSTQASQALWGLFNGGAVSVPGVPEGGKVLIQIRAWSVGFATYDAARADTNPTTLIGASNLLGSPNGITLGGPGGLPIPSTSALGLQSFTATPVPEPSSIVLGLLGGLGAMVLLRRRK